MKKDYIFVAQVLKQPEQKEVKIEIPEGYCIDESKSTFEKIVFKKKDNKPRSWKEYCENNIRIGRYYIDSESDIIEAGDGKLCTILDRNVLPSKELAEAFLAMMQLMSLRQAWIGDWDSNRLGYTIMLDVERNIIVSHDLYHRPLTFPERELALEFRNCFKDLLEIAKPLI